MDPLPEGMVLAKGPKIPFLLHRLLSQVLYDCQPRRRHHRKNRLTSARIDQCRCHEPYSWLGDRQRLLVTDRSQIFVGESQRAVDMEENSSLAEPLRLEEVRTDSMVVDDSSMEVASVEDMSKS
jgi:hypothetical protein